MYPKLKTAATVGVVLTGLLAFFRSGLVSAQEETEIPKSSRGGILATAEGHRFEIFFFPTGARVFPLDGTGKPTDASRLAGGATFYHPNAPGRPWFSRPLHHEPTAAGQAPTSLDLIIGLSKAPQKGASVVFEITGLSRSRRIDGDIQGPARVRRHDGAAADRAPGRGRGGPTLHLRPWLLWLRLLREPGT